jgi:hypothetical protein
VISPVVDAVVTGMGAYGYLAVVWYILGIWDAGGVVESCAGHAISADG